MSGPWEDFAAPEAGPWADYAPSKPKPKRSFTQNVTGAMAQVNRGLGIGDEMAAGFQTGANVLTGRVPLAKAGEGYNNALAAQRGYEADFAGAHPNASALAQGTGMAATSIIPAGRAIEGGNMLANAARGTVAAAGTGAVYAGADAGSIPERLKAAGDAAMNPLNAVVGGIAGRFGTAPKPKTPKPPTLPELTTQRKAAYKAVESSGHRYTPEGFAGLVGDIKSRLAKEQFDGDFQPKVQLMLDRLDAKAKQGYAPTLGEMDELRKFVIKNVRGDGNTARLGSVIREGIDSFIDTQGGNAAELVGKARGLYKRESKVKEVTKVVAKAERQAARTGSGGNANNSIRSKLDTMLEKNPYLSTDEKAAIEEIVMGTKSQNALRQAGKLSPQGNGLMLAGHLAALGPSGGTSSLVAVGGALAKSKADNMTRQKVRELVDLMASGGSREQLLSIQKQVQDIEGPAGAALRKMVSTRLARAGGVASASSQRPSPSASPAR